jgi:predicted transcriptional regulator
MEIHFSPEQEAQLAQIAGHTGTDKEGLVRDAALRMIDETARFRAAVREGIEQADRGELLEDDDVLGWLEGQERR